MPYFEIEARGTDWSDGIIEPVLAPKVYKMSCCGCGLVHDFEFSIGKDEADKEDRVHFRVRRNPRATGQIRRRMVRLGEGIYSKFVRKQGDG